MREKLKTSITKRKQNLELPNAVQETKFTESNVFSTIEYMRTFLTASEDTSIKFEREIREAVVVEMERTSTNVACIRSMEHNN